MQRHAWSRADGAWLLAAAQGGREPDAVLPERAAAVIRDQLHKLVRACVMPFSKLYPFGILGLILYQ